MNELPFEDLAIGQYLTLRKPDLSEIRFQNFYIGETAIWEDPELGVTQYHTFLPFGFSGIAVNRQGDNVDATVVFPNTAISRSFLDQCITERWTCVVRVCLINNLSDAEDPPQQLHRYVGQAAGGAWKDAELALRLNSILDAVGSEIPARTIHQRLVGDLPVTGQIALQ